MYPLGAVVVLRSVSCSNHAFLDAQLKRNISCMTVSKDGQYLATGHETSGANKVEAVIWDLQQAITHCENNLPITRDSCLKHVLHQHHGKVQALDFSYDGLFLATLGGQDDNDIVVWNVKTGKSICGSPAATDTSRCVKWLNQRSDRFVTCGNYHFRVWQVCFLTPKIQAVDANIGSMRRVMQCLSISHDDTFGFAGSKTGEVLKFRIDRDDIKPLNEPYNQRPSLQGYNKDRFSKGVKSVVCITNPLTGNTNVIAGAGDGVLQLLNPKLQLIQSHKSKLSGAVTSISLSSNSEKFIAGTELSQWYRVKIDDFDPKLQETCHYGEIYDVKFPRDCSKLFVTASEEEIRVWNAQEKQELMRIRMPNLSCHAIDITISGSNIISAWSDGKIRSFYPESGKVSFTIQDAHSEEVTSLANCNDNDQLGSWRLVSGGKDGRVRVWKITKSHQVMIHNMKEHNGAVNAVCCNKEGTRVISAASDGSCIVWDLVKGVRIHALFDATVFQDILYHPEECQYLSCSTNFKISYWDAFDASEIRSIKGGDAELVCLGIQPQGNFFVSGGADKAIRLWHYDDGICIAVGKGHSGQVNSVAISPDQSRLVSVGSEGGIFVWRLDNIPMV